MSSGWSRNRLKFLLAGSILDAVNSWIPGDPHHRLVERVASAEPEQILELCGGTGYAARLLAKRLPGAQILSLDISPEMIAVGRRRLAAKRTEGVTLHEGDAAALPFPDQSFDAVMTVFGLHELPSDVRRKALNETARVLRPGGRLVVVDLDRPRSGSWAFDAYLRIAERAAARDVLGLGLVEELTVSGYAVAQHEPASGWRKPFQLIEAYA